MAKRRRERKQSHLGQSSPERKRTRSATSSKKTSDFGDFPLKKENFAIIAAGFALIITGYILMYGTENIFSFRHMGLPVMVILSGFVIQLYGIMGKPNFWGSHDQEKAEKSPQ